VAVDYTIVLREKAGTAIQFERGDRGSRAQTLETGGIFRADFNRRLDAHGELRYYAIDRWGWARRAGPQFRGAGTLGMLSVERHFVGKDANGQTVVVPVRVNLERSFGHACQPPRAEPPTPPATSLEPQDLKALVGPLGGLLPDSRVSDSHRSRHP
jgi:hypothetical protein